jgi:hypothetical protein
MSFIDIVKDTFTTADFDVQGNMRVKTLQKNFSESFGCELRIYNGKRFAEEDYTIAKIRDSKIVATGEEFTIRASWTVDRLEKQFTESFGIKVQVALPGNGGLAENSQSLGDVSRTKNTTKGDTMAEISINGRKKVSTLKREFKSEYGLTLDVKQGKSNHSAAPHKSLSDIRDPESPGGKAFSIRGNMKVGNLEKRFQEMGVKVNIKKSRGGFVSNDVTLGSVRTK